MDYPINYPGAIWVGSKKAGKPWVGTTTPMVVLHTLEFNAFPQPEKWDSPSHLVYDPNTRECRQYLPMDVAAYAVRDNPQEDDEPTWQVELFGRAAAVPYYDDNWYQGLAKLCDTFVEHYGIEPVFADFTPPILSGIHAPQRMADDDVTAFGGFLGHCHMGYGTDEHWDPGALDVARVVSFMKYPEDDEEETMQPTLELFVKYVRKVDIKKMGADKIIELSEVDYFTGPSMWNPDGTKVDESHEDWSNLFYAWLVRNPIWAV